jgi:hypothetical protein
MMMRKICRYQRQSYNPVLFSMQTSKVKGSGAATVHAMKQVAAKPRFTAIIGNRKSVDFNAYSVQLL